MCATEPHCRPFRLDKFKQTIQSLTSAQIGFNMLHSNCQSGTTLTSLVKKELPNAHFLMMEDYDVFGIIAETEAFPSFVTDASLQERAAPKGKKILEIDESYATTEYHLIWQKKNYTFLKPLIEKSH